jgi:hypothetical protein
MDHVDTTSSGMEDDNESLQTGSESSSDGEDDGDEVTLAHVANAADNLFYEAGRTIVDYCFSSGFLTPSQAGQPPAPPP